MSWETRELGKIVDGQKRRPLRKRAPFLMTGRIKDREDREVYSLDRGRRAQRAAECLSCHMTLKVNPVTLSFPLEGKCLEEAKGCTRQSIEVALHRCPDRQSAVCVIFASCPWACLRYEGS